MKKFICCICLMAVLLGFSACGGSKSQDTSAQLAISSIIGNGSAPDIFANQLIVTGANFVSDMAVDLKTTSKSFSLPYSFLSTTQIIADLPGSLAEGDYILAIAARGQTAERAITILKGEKGDAGLSIVRNKQIDSSNIDMCTEYVGEECYFAGGQLVEYSDGSILLVSSFVFIYVNTVVSDTDTNETAITWILQPDFDWAWTRLSRFVARGTGWNDLYLVYQRDPETLTLVHDTNGDGLDDTDELITTLTLSDW